jgi:hypothetical protein
MCCTDINAKNVIRGLQPPAIGCHHTANANRGVVTAEARIETAVPCVDEYEGECDGQDPMQRRQAEHESGDSEEPFPRSTLESIAAVPL